MSNIMQHTGASTTEDEWNPSRLQRARHEIGWRVALRLEQAADVLYRAAGRADGGPSQSIEEYARFCYEVGRKDAARETAKDLALLGDLASRLASGPAQRGAAR